jgi:hypothetical protein
MLYKHLSRSRQESDHQIDRYPRVSRAVGKILAGSLLIAPFVLTGSSAAGAESFTSRHPERGGLLLESGELRAKRIPIPGAKPAPAIDVRSSIFVTDKKTVEQLTFSEIMQQLVDQSGDTSLTKEKLFAQWWDSANQKPGVAAATHHCDDISSPDPTTRLSTLNGFPYRCPRPEGNQASQNPFDPTKDEGYIAIAYSNRFDLADNSGRDCGQYRVVFARVSGANTGFGHPGDATNRNLIIFEAGVKNPLPPTTIAPPAENDPNSMENLRGCKPIVQFWANLSNPKMTTVERGKALKDFFLKGLPDVGVGPVIHVDNFRGDGHGQIRSNQFITHGVPDPTNPDQKKQFDWTLREFKIDRDPATLISIAIIPQTVKSNPAATLFDRNTTDIRAPDFYDQVVSQLDALRGGLGGEFNIDTFSYNNPDKFNSFESDESSDLVISKGGELGSVFDQFAVGSLADPRGYLYRRLEHELEARRSNLTPEQISARLQTQTCSGCHRFSNKNLFGNTANPANANPANDLGPGLNWTQSLGFTHESEAVFEAGPDGNGTRYLISDLLKDVFLPERLENMQRFLAQP